MLEARIDLTISAYVDNQLRRSHAQDLTGIIVKWDDEKGEDVVIGSIEAWKIIWFDADCLTSWASAVSCDCSKAFEWLLSFNKAQEHPLFDEQVFSTLWIESVHIDPEHRGHFANPLKLVATFLDLANADTVFARCGFVNDEAYNDRLFKLWKKLGFERDEDYLWLTGGWDCPKWLQGNFDIWDPY